MMLGTSLDSTDDTLSPDCVVGSCGLHLLKGFILRLQIYGIASTSPDSSGWYHWTSTVVSRESRPSASSRRGQRRVQTSRRFPCRRPRRSFSPFSVDGTLSVNFRASVIFFEPHLRSQFPERLPAEPDVVLTDETLFASRHPADVSVVVSRIVRLLGSTVFLGSLSCHD